MNSKLQIRSFLIHNSKGIMNIKVLLGCFPIIIGVSKIFYSKHQDQTILNIFKQNLPGISSPQTQISWPTFEQIISDQLQLDVTKSSISNMSSSTIKRVDFYTDSALIQTAANWHTKQKQLYIGALNNFELSQIESKKQIGNNWYTIFSKTTKKNIFTNKTKYKKNWNLYPNFNTTKNATFKKSIIRNNFFTNLNKNNKNNYFLNLDELPLKLNCNYINKQTYSKNILENMLPINVLRLKPENTILQSKTIVKASTPTIPAFSSDNFDKLYKDNKTINKVIKQKIFFSFKKIFPDNTKKPIIGLKGIQNFVPQIKINSIENHVMNFTGNFYIKKKKNFLENKLKENFYNKHLLPFSNLTYLNFWVDPYTLKEKKPKTEISMLYESVFSENWVVYPTELLELVQLIEEVSTFHESFVILPRVMSGYTLPDTTHEHSLLLLTQFFYKNNSNLLHTVFSQSVQILWNPILEINLSKNFSYSLNFLNTKLIPPSFKFFPQSQRVNYFFPDNQEKNIYEGASIVQNKITNDLNITNFNQVKQWVKQFLNSDNILTDRREIFFGKNAYIEQKTNEEILKNTISSCSSTMKTKLNKSHSIKVALLKKGRAIMFFEMPLKPTNLASRPKNINGEVQLAYDEILEPSSIITYDEYPYIIHLNKKEWKIFFEQLSEEKNELIPIANVRFPKQKFIAWPLNQFNSKKLGKFLPHNLKKQETITTINSLKPCPIPKIYHYFPYSQSLLKEVLPKKYFFGKVYKNNSSTYTNKKKHKNKPPSFTTVFYESVEPISVDSWLFFAQFSIGLFLLQILQNISQKYGKEMKYVISSLLEGKTDNSNSIDSNLDENDPHENFRLIKNIKRNFRDIAGIDAILPELSEIVWFLRNSGRSFKVGNTLPRRILLTGPPGTGKTLLVQAIAGEAEVPVLIESGSSLNQGGTSEGSSERLKNIFNQAREIAPCIIFIDEIDTFGEARDQMLENPIINNEILASIYPNNKASLKNTFQIENSDFIPHPKLSTINETIDSNKSSNFQFDIPVNSSNSLFNQINKNVTQKHVGKSKATQEKSNLLMQFLIELDGIATEKKILVFGATNRPQILDAALTRPGRFNKILNLNLPNKQKRIEILKLYSKNLGVDKNISWNYLANLTPGLSAADLASVMNQSSMKAIQTETVHTVETIEYGIESITGYISQKNQLKSFTQLKKNDKNSSSKFLFLNRLAYYQAGKALVHTFLEYHPKVVSIHLWPQLKNPRYHLVNGIIEKEFSQIRTRIELESRIIGFYGGKAAELLALFHGFKNLEFSLQEKIQDKRYTKSEQSHKHQQFLYLWQSDLGIQDINLAGWLSQLMISKWYLYSKQISVKKFNLLKNNSNLENIPDNTMLELFKQLSCEMETEINKETISIRGNSQNWVTKPWLQKQITQKLEFSYSTKNNWYKIYEGDHEENENTRCISPDDYYHNNAYLNNLLNNKFLPANSFSSSVVKQFKDQNYGQTFFKSSITWNDIANLDRDYIYHSFILTCFNKSISILDKNRELLDFLASCLTQKEIIREHELIAIINTFQKNEINFNTKENTVDLTASFFTNIFTNCSEAKDQAEFKNQNKETNIKSETKKKKLGKNWSSWSQKKQSRFLDFKNI